MDAAQPKSIMKEDMIAVFKESNNLYFSLSWYTGKDRKVLKSNRENLLYILGKALDSEAREAIEKVVCGSCAVSTFDSPRDEIRETSVRSDSDSQPGVGTEGGLPSSGGPRGLLLPGVDVSNSRRFCDVTGNDKKSSVLSSVWIAKWKCDVACDKLFA